MYRALTVYIMHKYDRRSNLSICRYSIGTCYSPIYNVLPVVPGTRDRRPATNSNRVILVSVGVPIPVKYIMAICI